VRWPFVKHHELGLETIVKAGFEQAEEKGDNFLSANRIFNKRERQNVRGEYFFERFSKSFYIVCHLCGYGASGFFRHALMMHG